MEIPYYYEDCPALLLLFSFQATARLSAQSVSISLKDVSISVAMEEISKQTSYEFAYNKKILKRAKSVTLNLQNETLEESLKQLFSNQPFTYTINDKIIIIEEKPISKTITTSLSVQEKQESIRGRVADSLGNPLQGASVRVKWAVDGAVGAKYVSTLQTTTDRSGEFLLQNVPDDAFIEISYIGYVTQEVRAAANLGTIVLRATSSELDEVELTYSTGYQSIPKERATGSFTHIDNDLFNRSVSTDLISRLEGVTNGLAFELPATRGAPSSNPDLRIRGLSTINGETEPLIVVDNFPYEGDISNINPNDVESITVLKDAAAASIWGARAGNGVIVITTKGGVVSRKPTVNVNSNVTIIEKPDLFYSRTFLPPAEAVELERTLYGMGLYTKNDWTAVTPAIEILFALDEGLIDEPTANRQLDGLKQYDIRDEAAKYLYRRGVNQQYALNITGGGENNRYYLSAGFDNNASNLVGDGYRRVTLSAKNDFQPLERLTISTSLNYMHSTTQSNGIGILSLNPSGMNDPYVYARLADEQGNALPIVRNNKFTYTDGATEMGLLDWHYRPLDELRMNDNTSGSQEVRLNTAVRYDLFRGLGAEARYQYQNIGDHTRNHYVEESYYARNLINQYTQEDGSQPIPLGGILDRSSSTFASHYGRLQLDYSGSWAGRHELTGLTGFELRQERSVGNGTSRLYGYDDEVLTHVTNLDFNTSFPTRPSSSGTIPYINSPGSQITDRFVYYYANFGYTLDSKYILSTSARWDASNIFGVEFNQKGVPLWSVGAAWNASGEPFFTVDWVNLAKLRLTYGSNGNAVRSLSSLPYITYEFTNAITGLPMGRLLSVGNPDLSWEQVNTVNLGLDFALLNHRFSGSIEWYSKKSNNLIGADLFDPTTGIIPTGSSGSYNLDNQRNYADLNTKGIDIELNTVNIDRRLKWQTTVLFSRVLNTVTNYNNSGTIAGSDLFTAVSPPLIVGNPIDQLYSLPWYGLDGTGAPLVMVDGELGTDYNAYFNNLAPEDLIKVGVTTPPYFGSVRNTFTWRSLSAGINIVWKAGHWFRRGSISYSNLFGTSKATHIDFLDRWQQPGDEHTTNVPSMPESSNTRRDNAYLWSEANLEKGDHVRLQDVNLSYQLPERYSRNIGLSQVRVYAFASNLGLLWKHTDYDIDPAVNALYPSPMQVSFGLQIQL